jgi:hypothetical protein
MKQKIDAVAQHLIEQVEKWTAQDQYEFKDYLWAARPHGVDPVLWTPLKLIF